MLVVHDFVLVRQQSTVFLPIATVALVDIMVHAWVNVSKFHIFHDSFLISFVCVCVGGLGIKNANSTFEQANSGKWLFSAKTNKSEQGGGKSKIDSVF